MNHQKIGIVPVTELETRWNNIQNKMQALKIEGCLLATTVNIYYTAGFVFGGYFYIPCEGKPLYFVKRPEGLKGENIFYIRKPEQIAEILVENNFTLPKRLMIETDELSYNESNRLINTFNNPEIINGSSFMRQIRMIKSEWEIEQFKISATKHQKVYEQIPFLYKKEMSDLELQIEIEKEMRLQGSLGIFRAFGNNMEIFMGSLLAGENAETPSPYDFSLGGEGVHPFLPLGANGTFLKEGTTIMVDMSENYTPYQTDMTRVFSIGKLDEKAYTAHQLALKMQEEMVKKVTPGVSCADIYHITYDLAKEGGFEKYFMGTNQQAKFVGHGVGLQINELPILAPRSKEVFEPGMVFAFEPKFVLPSIGAVGIENTFLVTETGVEQITHGEEKIINLLEHSIQ
ncbi:MAG: Xaa-Pro peptidase family protein [Odoribacter sp.]|nr:Xaa-Pro peptidase family protein [Odoribacter sp.]